MYQIDNLIVNLPNGKRGFEALVKTKLPSLKLTLVRKPRGKSTNYNYSAQSDNIKDFVRLGIMIAATYQVEEARKPQVIPFSLN